VETISVEAEVLLSCKMGTDVVEVAIGPSWEELFGIVEETVVKVALSEDVERGKGLVVFAGGSELHKLYFTSTFFTIW